MHQDRVTGMAVECSDFAREHSASGQLLQAIGARRLLPG